MPRRIHPTAVIDPAADLADDVTVGPFAVIDGPVRLGPGCTVAGHAQLLGNVTAGANNEFGPACVVGGKPQHTGYKGEPTGVVIGDHNVFREHVTIHRAMPTSGYTRVGSHNYLMASAHVAHDCVVGDHCMLANGALLGGHVQLGDRAFISGNAAVHQNCRVGRLAMLSGTSAVTQDLPPFYIAQGDHNIIRGINIVGMRRAGLAAAEIGAVRKAFRTLHLRGLTITAGVAAVEREFGQVPAVRELLDFIRSTKRGVCAGVGRDVRDDSADEARRAA